MENGRLDLLSRMSWIPHNGVFHVNDKGANLAIGLVAVGGVAASKVRW